MLVPARTVVADVTRELQRRINKTSERFIGAVLPTVPAEVIPFLDPIDQLCEEVPPRFLRSSYYAVVAMFISSLLIASIVKVDVVVTGTGRLSTESPPILLQSIDRAIIRELPVKPGDVVTKGQVLATLDPTFAQADFTSFAAQDQALQSQSRRLQAELEGKPFQPSASSDDQLQNTLFSQRQAQYASQMRVYDEDIQRQKANIKTSQDHRSSQEKQLAIAKDIENMRSSMLEKQVGSRLNYLDAQAARMRIEQDIEETANRLVELDHQLQSKQAERQSFIDQWRHQILDSMVTTKADLAKMGDDMAKASLINNLVVITAPEDGVVLDVAKRSTGSVVTMAEPIVTMVQKNSPFIADITINSADIGYTKAGADVVVKVDAFPYQRHGFLHGKLQYVGEESFSTSGARPDDALAPPNSTASGAYHRGRIELKDTKLENLPAGAHLIPGMTLSAEIKVGSRSVLSYFLDPLTRAFRESIREP